MNEFPSSGRPLSLLFTGGGTGGHLFPGLAVAEHFRELFPDTRVLFIGSDRSLEQQILAETPFESLSLPVLSPRTALRHPWKFWQAHRASSKAACRLLKEFAPDAILGLGGFASYPILAQAPKLRIPYLLLEQNAVPGRVTSLFASEAAQICLSFAGSERYFRRSCPLTVTGNPLRKNILNLPAPSTASTTPTLVIAGGSQGSQIINQFLIRFLQQRPSELQGWTVRHQTGSQATTARPGQLSLIQELTARYQQLGLSADVRPFFTDAAELYQDAHLVVCRAGGTTLAEVDWLQIPALIVPIHKAVRNHQFHNAQAHLKRQPIDRPSAIVPEHQPDSEQQFQQTLRRMLQQYQQPISRSETSVKEKPPSAADQVVTCLQQMLSSRF